MDNLIMILEFCSKFALQATVASLLSFRFVGGNSSTLTQELFCWAAECYVQAAKARSLQRFVSFSQ